jgi:tetratricopeptide (TPR) repeat protein
MVYFYLGREREAIEHWEKTRHLAPAGTYMVMTEHALWKGDYEKAKELHSMVERLQPTHQWVTWMKGFIAAQTGDKEEALRVIRHLEESRGGVEDLSLNGIAFIYYALGNLDSYFSYMNQAVESHVANFAYPMYCPLFAAGRADLRYQKLIEKMRQMYWPDRK